MKQEGTAAYTRWLKSRETLLYQGHADKIADELEKTARKGAVNAEQLNTAAGDFRTHHQRMHYLEMREEEWPIGRGMVESGAKQFKARFSGPGKAPKTCCQFVPPSLADALTRWGTLPKTCPPREVDPKKLTVLTRPARPVRI
jgi:hypothetical protein